MDIRAVGAESCVTTVPTNHLWPNLLFICFRECASCLMSRVFRIVIEGEFAAFSAPLWWVILQVVCVSRLRHVELVHLILHKLVVPRFGFFSALSSSPV